MESSFGFYFEIIGDVIKFSETTISVYASTYKEAITKVHRLKLPELERYDDINEHLKLTAVEEVIVGIEPPLDDEEETEPK